MQALYPPPHGAASWAVATSLVGRLGSTWTISEAHPGDGLYDTLVVHHRTRPNDHPVFWLNRPGRLHLEMPGRDLEPLTHGEIWPDLVAGAAGVRATADHALRSAGLPTDPVPPSTSEAVYRLMTRALAKAAVFDIPWFCVQADPTWEVSGELMEPFGITRESAADPSHDTSQGAERYWVLLETSADATSRTRPLALFQTSGAVTLAGTSVREIEATDAATVAHLSDELFDPLIKTAVRGVDPISAQPPSAGLPMLLSTFNRKERLFLVGWVTGSLDTDELHAPGLALSPAFLEACGRACGLEVPAHAWAGMDYHLNWIHAALSWSTGAARPGQQLTYPPRHDSADHVLITGDQEDVDILLAWTAGGVPHLLMVEAKAYGSWGNAQLQHKLARLDAIIAAQHGPLKVAFVMTSPRKPQHLHSENWPQWVSQDAWMPLPTPRSRVAPQRCMDNGKPSDAGAFWKLIGP